nr:putative late blight resistance protein homolog R1B-16 isoform X1 [Ipomoea batatas]
MACVGLISLIRTVELQFLEQRPFLVVDYKDEIQCLHQRLSVLLTLVEESEKKLNVSEAERDVIARVKEISFTAEDEIESEIMEILSNGASHETLHQILQQLVLKIPNVKVLGIECSESYSDQTETWWDNLHYLTKLEKLIVGDYESIPFELQSINSFPQSLKELKIAGTQLGWEFIRVISMLPNLESLELLYASKMGEEWETGDGGFPKLKFLFITEAKLKKWETMSDHFPVLQRLALHNCHDLEKIPEDFENSTTLELIELKDCCLSLVKSAKDIQEAQSTYGNDQLVVRDYETRSW